MAESAASTAYGVMAQIALEQALPKARRIFDDPLAVQMLSPSQQALTMFMSMRPLRAPVARLLEKFAPGIAAGILSRKRYIDEALADALKHDIDTVVILGAGLDTLAYRNLQLAQAHVYEVDLPGIITYKQKRVQQIFQKLPAHVTYVPIDFETQTLGSVLTAQSYSLDRKTFFVWEGVTQYLTEAGVRSTFEFLAKASAGSRLVFTYVQQDFIDGVNLYGARSLYARFRRRRQVWHFGIRPDDVAAFLAEYGWRLVDNAGPDYFVPHYIAPTGRRLGASQLEWTAYARKT